MNARYPLEEDSTFLALEANDIAADGTSTCPMCGKAFPHKHSPEELVIFRNGLKRALRAAAENVAINETIESRTVDKHGSAIWGARGVQPTPAEADRRYPHRAPHRVETRRVSQWEAQE